MGWLKNLGSRLVHALFGKKEIHSIIIKKQVLEKICGLARDAHPREFLAFVEGATRGHALIITDIVFQSYVANEMSALPRMDLPIINNVYGSVHSHPAGSNRPSIADTEFFAHHGAVHFIIKAPYREMDLKCYDWRARERPFTVG